MGHGTLIARKTAEVLRGIGYDCTDEGGSIVIPKWGVRVDVVEGKVNEQPGRVAIFPSIVTLHRYLPGGFARELGVGMGKTLEQAADGISATWMLLFFPLLKFLYDSHPHDCTVHEEPVAIPHAAQPEYRLLAGPLQSIGFDQDHPADMSQSFLWNAFRDDLLPQIRAGVHHLRCYAYRAPHGTMADVFVDGAEWSQGSERLRKLAEAFPPPSDEHPVYALKQHLLLRPDDLEAAVEEEKALRVAQWRASVGQDLDAPHAVLLEDVLDALFTLSRYGTESEHEAILVREGMDRQTAGRLVTFLPSAAARVVLRDRVTFAQTYYWVNARTRRAVERRYDQTPVFSGACEVLRRLHDRGAAQTEISNVASTSAEMNGVARAMEKNSKLEGFRFTTMIHHTDEAVEGEDLDRLLELQSKAAPKPPRPAAAPQPWWKFW